MSSCLSGGFIRRKAIQNIYTIMPTSTGDGSAVCLRLDHPCLLAILLFSSHAQGSLVGRPVELVFWILSNIHCRCPRWTRSASGVPTLNHLVPPSLHQARNCATKQLPTNRVNGKVNWLVFPLWSAFHFIAVITSLTNLKLTLLIYVRIYETYPKLSRMYSFWFSIYGNNPFSTEKPDELVHLVSKVNLARRSAFSQELYVSSQNERHRI